MGHTGTFQGYLDVDLVTNDDWAKGRRQLEVCPEYLLSKCTRGATRCKFAHPEENVKKVAKCVNVCLDSLMRTRKCNFKDCKYYHPPTHIVFADITRGRLDLCPDYMEAECLEPKCILGHPDNADQIIRHVAVCDCVDEDCEFYHSASMFTARNDDDICYDYTQGNCNRNSCKFSHDTDGRRSPRGRSRGRRETQVRRPALRSRSRGRGNDRDGGYGGGKQDMFEMMWKMCSMMSSMPKGRGGGERERVRPDFNKMADMFERRGNSSGGGEVYRSGASSRDPPRPRASRVRKSETCRDYMNGRCGRTDDCLFSHDQIVD